jgi:hypothetical protein
MLVFALPTALLAQAPLTQKRVTPLWESDKFLPTAVIACEKDWLIVGDGDGHLYSIDDRTGATKHHIVAHGDAIRWLSACAAQRLVISVATREESIRFSSYDHFAETRPALHVSARWTSLSQDGARLVAVGTDLDDPLRVFEVESGKETRIAAAKLRPTGKSKRWIDYTSIAIDPPGKRVFVGHRYGACIVDLEGSSTQILLEVDAPAAEVVCDSQLREMFLWTDVLEVRDIASKRTIAKRSAPQIDGAPFQRFQIFPEHGLVMGALAKGIWDPVYLWLWRYRGKDEMAMFEPGSGFAAVSPDGRYIYTGHQGRLQKREIEAVFRK